MARVARLGTGGAAASVITSKDADWELEPRPLGVMVPDQQETAYRWLIKLRRPRGLINSACVPVSRSSPMCQGNDKLCRSLLRV